MRTFTDHEDAVICVGYSSGRRVADIAAELGRTRNMIIGRARRLGLSDPARRNLFTEAEDNELIQSYLGWEPLSSIARRLGRSRDAIDHRRRSLELTARRNPSAGRRAV